MNETKAPESKGNDFWKEHVIRAQSFAGSDYEYCKINELTKSTFATHKNRLGFTKKAQAQRAFIEVAPQIDHEQASRKNIPQRKSVDPQWLADLILALTSER